ncbi:hypothetical protein OROGR_025231 [Orobanche gracilis]
MCISGKNGEGGGWGGGDRSRCSGGSGRRGGEAMDEEFGEVCPEGKLKQLADAMNMEMHAGLASECGSKLKMLISFVDYLPIGAIFSPALQEETKWEIVEVMKRTRINIMCIQETKWVGNKAKEIALWGYKLWYSGKDKGRNGVGILIDKEHIDDVVAVSRKSDRIMSIKLVMGEEVVNIISAYAPQIGLDVSIKQAFWDDLEEVVQQVPREEKMVLGGDLNGHVGSRRDGFESVHGGFGFGDKNEAVM